MYVLKRSVRADGVLMGDIIPLSQLCAVTFCALSCIILLRLLLYILHAN